MLTSVPSLNCWYASCNPICEWAGGASVLSGWAGGRGIEETHRSSCQVDRTGGYHISNHRIHGNFIAFIHLACNHLIFGQYLSHAFCVSGFVRVAGDTVLDKVSTLP